MDKGYVFPRNVPISKQNIGKATPVTIEMEYYSLYQASSYDLLRCVYANCLEPLSPVREDGSDTVVSHFAHRPAASAPYCPYRSEWREPPTTRNSREREKYQHNIRKLIESRLYEELLRKLPGARISMSDDHDREPRIQIDGLARPLLILSLAPHDEWLWKEPFDGTIDGRQVLFFIAGPDLPYLKANEVNQKLLRKSSAITVHVPTEDGRDFTFKIPGELPGTPPVPAATLEQLDLIYVNYQTLFGLNRKPEYLFIKTPQKSPLELIEQQLKSTIPALTRKLLQLLAKRLLVESTRVHQIVFQQTFSESQDFFRECNTFPGKNQLIDLQEVQQLQRDTAVETLLKEKSLAPVYKEFLLQAAEIPIKKLQQEKQAQANEFEAKRKEMQDTIQKLQQEKQTQANEFEAKQKEMRDTVQKLQQSSESVKVQLEQKRKQHEDESSLRKQLAGEVEKLKNQVTEKTKSEVTLREQLDNEKKRAETLSNAIQTLQRNPVTKFFLNRYKIHPS